MWVIYRKCGENKIQLKRIKEKKVKTHRNISQLKCFYIFHPSKDEKHYKTNIIVHTLWQIKNLKRYKKDHVTEAARLLLPRKNNSGGNLKNIVYTVNFFQGHTNIWNPSFSSTRDTNILGPNFWLCRKIN